MRKVLLAIAILVTTASAQAPPPTIPLAPIATPQDVKLAKKEFKQGLKSRNDGHPTEAFDHFKRASDLDVRNLDYVTARELMRQYVVYQEIQRGNEALSSGRQIEAMAAFRSALELDPANTFAKQRLLDSVPALPQVTHLDDVSVDPLAAAAEIHLRPKEVLRTFRFRGDSRQIIEQVATAYGLTPVLDESVRSQRVRFEVGDVDWATAVNLLAKMCKVFWTPLSANQVMFVADNDQNRRAMQRMSLRTFYVPNAATTQDLNEIANTLRVLFDIRYLTIQPATNTIVVRASQPMIDAATTFLEGLSTDRPQVLLDVKVYQVSRSAARQIGTDVPRSFTAFNVPTEAQKLLGNQSIQDIIDQLIGSGAINQAGSTAIAALIAQGISGQNSIFSQPFGVFGGGITLTGVTLPPGTLHLNFNSSELRSLEHVTLRASHGDSADFRIGTRYPIMNASFAPIYNSSSITKVLANKSYIPPVPSFTYEDLGIILKTKPQISANDVRLDFELEIRSLGATSFNGIPIINNREYKGAISAADGQTIVIGGLLTSTEQNNLTGLPLLSRLPGIGVAFSTQSKTQEDDELLLVMTPHIVRPRGMTAQEIRLPASASR